MPEEQEQTEAAIIDPSKILVRGMPGFLYSPISKRMYYSRTREEVGDATYNRPWSVNPYYGFEQPIYPLNPVDFCTQTTADRALEWARAQWPSAGLVFELFVPTPEGYVTESQYWLICWNGQDLYEIFSAGWWMFDLQKDGQQAAYEQRTSELRAAGFSV